MNFFGEGFRYWAFDTHESSWEPLRQYKLEYKCTWEDLLLDLDILKRLGYDHWDMLTSSTEKNGFFIHANNRIEIKKGARFLEKFNASNLIHSSTLFPVYRTEFQLKHLHKKQDLVIVQFETGLLAKYTIDTQRLKIEDLLFTIENVDFIKQMPCLSELKYQNLPLQSISDDTVVRGVRVVVIE